jgi:hypothetical protein
LKAIRLFLRGGVSIELLSDIADDMESKYSYPIKEVAKVSIGGGILRKFSCYNTENSVIIKIRQITD